MLNGAIADIRALAGVPANYKILMLQGGASLQFSMVPMNLLDRRARPPTTSTPARGPTRRSRKPRRVGTRQRRPARPRPTTTTAFPAQRELTLTPGAAYVHITTNNTIEGTEWQTLPDVGDAPLVADASSDIFSRPIDVGRYGLIYAGAQKNLGPSGVTLVIIREDLLARSPDVAADDAELQGARRRTTRSTTRRNTFGIYILGLTMKWLKSLGGLPAIGARSTSARRRSSTPRSIAPASIAARRRRTAAR